MLRRLAVLITLTLSALAYLHRLPASAEEATVSSGLGTVHVDPVNGWDSPSCGSVSAPCRSVQQGFSRVAPGGIVKLAQGTYTAPGAPAVLDITFWGASKDFTVRGGYVLPNWDTPVPNPALSVLDGEGQRRVVNVVSVPDVRITFDNLSIVRGFVNTPVSFSGDFVGGGFHCRNDHPSSNNSYVQLTLTRLYVLNNTVMGYGNRPVAGGGIGAYQRCWLILEDVHVAHNKVIGGDAPDGTRGAHALGGGLFATASSGVYGEVLWFENNQAIAGSGGRGYLSAAWDRADALGGGAAFQYNWVRLRHVRFVSNTARAGWGVEYGGFGTGGGVFFEFSDAAIQDSAFIENKAIGGSATARGGEGHGGAVFLVDGRLRLDRVWIMANQAVGGNGADAGHAGGGGAYVAQFNSPTLFEGENLVVAHNRAEAGLGNGRWGGGGGVYIQRATALLTHTTISSNTVLSTMLAPAAIVQYSGGSLSLRHSIVSFHTGTSAAVFAHDQGQLNANNNLIWGNSLPAFGSWNGSTAVHGVITGNPSFVSAVDLNINSDSAAIDQAVGSTSQLDIQRKLRPIGAGRDLGAYEYMPPLPVRGFAPIIRR